MSKIAEKIAKLAKSIVSEKGDFDLLAIFHPEESTGLDLVFGAPWSHADKSAAITYMVSKLHDALTKSEVSQISRVIPLQSATAILSGLLGETRLDDGIKTHGAFTFNDVPVRQAEIIVLSRPAIRKRR